MKDTLSMPCSVGTGIVLPKNARISSTQKGNNNRDDDFVAVSLGIQCSIYCHEVSFAVLAYSAPNHNASAAVAVTLDDVFLVISFINTNSAIRKIKVKT
jgi:hypothetical protein